MVGVATKFAISEPDRAKMRRGIDVLALAGANSSAGLTFTKADGGRAAVELPASVFKSLRTVLTRMAESDEVLLVSEDTELSPEEAARILGISRPLVYQRMDDGRLPFREVGSHRRALVRDVLALIPFEERIRKASRELAEDTADIEANYARSPKSAS